MASVKTAVLGVVGALSAAGLAVGAMTKQVIDNAREQRLWARRLDVSEESFGALAAVAKRFGAEADNRQIRSDVILHLHAKARLMPEGCKAVLHSHRPRACSLTWLDFCQILLGKLEQVT